MASAQETKTAASTRRPRAVAFLVTALLLVSTSAAAEAPGPANGQASQAPVAPACCGPADLLCNMALAKKPRPKPRRPRPKKR